MVDEVCVVKKTPKVLSVVSVMIHNVKNHVQESPMAERPTESVVDMVLFRSPLQKGDFHTQLADADALTSGFLQAVHTVSEHI